ncbi:MAG: GAF domain-containing protein, partial [Chrysiogenales bacterium]
YSAIIHAFKKLMLRIIAEGPERTALWKDRILSALGDNCRIIIDVIPELELIVESHPELPEILSDKSQHRFNKVFGDFVRLFSRGDHPLVIFLDDIQWADHASLQLLDRLMSGIDTSYILLVLSYRDTEVGPDHPIAQMMLEMADRLSHIVLGPLSSIQLGEYLSSMIHSGSGDIAGLADQVHRKTNGNPFFMINFMRALHENGLLSFVSSQWTWDLEKIKEMKASDNVVELMAAKIRGLSPGTREVLKFAACAGNRADIEGLVLLSGRSIATVLTDIQEALDEGLLFHSRNNYHFVHDRIQEIVYSMIPPEERTAIHYRIGCFCLEKAGEGNLLEKIFYVAHQLNSGSGLMGSREERLRLARINLMAGRKAKDSTAYAEAAEFLGKGIGMMEDDAWNGEYRLVWDLHFEKAESEYLNGDFQGAFRIFDELMHRAENVIDRAKVYDRLIIMHTNTGSQRRGMERGLEALQMFGIRIPRKAGRVVLLGEIAKATFFLGRRRIPELLDSPEVKDPETIMAMTLCMNTGTAAYFVDSTIVALLAMKLVNMSLKHGNTSIASFAYLSFGLILGYGIGLFRTAFEFGGLAIRLNEKFNNIDLKPRILFIFGFLISHWRRHYSETIQLLRESYRNGIETGDLNYAVFSATNIIQYRMWLGDNLDQVYQELMGYRDFIFRAKNEEFIYEFILARQYILSHKGRTKSLSDYSDDAFDEKEFVEKIMKFRVTTHSYYIFKITSLYFDRKYREALDIAENADHSIGEVLYAQTNVAIFYLFYSLTLTALYAEADMRTRRKFRVRLAKNQALMKKWAAQCPENYLHGHHLVEAEIAAMKGRTTRAAAFYDRAIDTARESGFLRIAAIASARAGEFYLSCNRDIIARAYFSEAYYLFSRHGSTMIASELSRLFPQDAPHHHTAAATDTTSEQTTGSSGTRSLDLTTLLKTTQIISGEIVLEKLLKKLVVVIGESAAATNGALILEKDGKLLIEASGDIVSGRINVLQDMPIDSSSEISPAVVHYVARTKENLVLNDAVNIGLFTNDPYIMRKRCKSVLCIPIMYQAKLSAIFYAENNLTIHAFTEERIELLKTIASYAAISVDNARLYANLEEKVSERTRALEFAYDQVTEAYRIIQEDISLARRIQENLLTYRLERESPFNVDVHFYPMSEVGGDIYNIVEIKPGILRVFIADATGHGIQAALVTMLIRSEYEKVKTRHIHPSEIMGIINNEFIERYTNLPVLYTCVIADIDAHAQQIRYASAGHPDQYMLHDGRISVLSRTGKIIGFMRNLTYKQGELPFMPGDKIILFTDGIYEEFDMDLKEYGEKRLLDVVRRYSGEPVRVITKNILDDVRSFIGKERINASDDVTMIGIELKEGGEGSLV